MYYALAEFEEIFADKVSIYVALGPAVRLDHTTSKALLFYA